MGIMKISAPFPHGMDAPVGSNQNIGRGGKVAITDAIIGVSELLGAPACPGCPQSLALLTTEYKLFWYKKFGIASYKYLGYNLRKI